MARWNLFHGGLAFVQRFRWRGAAILQWNLEEPSATGKMGQTPGGAVVQGWVLFKPDLLPLGATPEIVASLSEHTELVHPLNCSRPDVIADGLHQESDNHPQQTSGFRFFVPIHAAPFRLFLRIATQQILLTTVKLPATRKQDQTSANVLQGKAGWLFLDNDTNNSVDQHCGTLRLTNRGLRAWRKYAKGLQRFGKSAAASTALLASPTKESVMADRHPIPPGGRSPMQQLSTLLPSDLLVHPVAPLAALGDDAFQVTDTHCSDLGSMVTTVELAKTLGLKSDNVTNLFAKDRYRVNEIVGDLGSKLTPVQTSFTRELDSYDHERHIVYDNGLRNFGRILAIQTPDALVDQTCLIFGSSSSYSMLKYTSRIFGRVILVHTAGNLDPQLISVVKPQFLVAQTNARFVVRIPILNYCVRDLLMTRIRELSARDRDVALANQINVDEQWLVQSGLDSYQRIVLTALSR